MEGRPGRPQCPRRAGGVRMEDTLGLARAILGATPRRWIELAETVPPALFGRPAAPGEWSAHDCLRHIVDTERLVFPQRVGFLLRGEDFPAFDPDAEGTKPGASADARGLAREFGRLRAASLEVLSRVGPDDLGRKARHRELGMVSLGELINEWAGHDLMHTVQAERAIMQLFIAGCGPWKTYFSDHVAG